MQVDHQQYHELLEKLIELDGLLQRFGSADTAGTTEQQDTAASSSYLHEGDDG